MADVNQAAFNVNRAASITRWTARLFGIMLVALWTVFFVGENLIGLKEVTPVGNIQMVFMVLTLAGLLLIWFAERTGAVLSIAAMVGFYLVNYLSSGSLPEGSVFLLFYVPGILALVSWRLAKKRVA